MSTYWHKLLNQKNTGEEETNLPYSSTLDNICRYIPFWK